MESNDAFNYLRRRSKISSANCTKHHEQTRSLSNPCVDACSMLALEYQLAEGSSDPSITPSTVTSNGLASKPTNYYTAHSRTFTPSSRSCANIQHSVKN
jgi:hypothetical protein